MMRLGIRRHISFVLALLLAFLLTVPYSESNRAIAASRETIRAAMYIDNGKTYRVTVPSVTLSAEKGLRIGNRTEGGFLPFVQAGPNEKTRFSLDGYRVFLLETADWQSAVQLANAIKSTKETPLILKLQRKSAAVYRVYAGAYANAEEARQALAGFRSGPAAARIGADAAPAGPLYWNAGSYPAEEAAAKQAALLRDAGAQAWVAVTQQSGAPAYTVLAGEAAGEEQLAETKRMLESVLPGIQLQPWSASAPYLLKREDITDAIATVSSQPQAGMTHYSFSPAGQKLLVAAEEGGIAIAEKSGRVYRGSMELRQWNGKLAVINELPFEQYLESVVAAEMSFDWPAEALKAQAVAARTFALMKGTKYEIADVSDSAIDQVYYGIGMEHPNVSAAVKATAGEVLMHNGSLIEPYFFSNGGGQTGDPEEVWGQPIGYLKSVASPDETAQAGKLEWYQVVLPNEKIGYIRSDFTRDSGRKSAAGLPILKVTEDGVNVRALPYVDNANNPPIAQVNAGDELTVIGKTLESNAYRWIRGPFAAETLLAKINETLEQPIAGPLYRLEVSKLGPSGRVTEIRANGRPIAAARSDDYRSMLGGIPSAKFEIEETGRYTVLGAGGQTREFPESGGALYALGSSGTAMQLTDEYRFMLGSGGTVRLATKEPQYRMTGYGNGHGLGMSQWGAKGLAEQGYDYKRILQYYYSGVTVGKE
jgi:stage II sporulation protein D